MLLSVMVAMGEKLLEEFHFLMGSFKSVAIDKHINHYFLINLSNTDRTVFPKTLYILLPIYANLC
jgi:hypothetical protein